MEIEFDKINPAKTAILVIDVQNDFCSKEGFPVKNWGHDVSHMDSIVENIKNFLGQAYISGVDILYTQLIYDKEKMPESLVKKLGDVVGKFAAPNSWGIDFYKINPPKDKIFVKYCFNGFTNSNLLNYLRDRGIENLIFVGFNSNICVESTARSALDLGFNIILLKDLIGTSRFMENHEKEMLSTFQIIFGDVLLSEEVLKLWKTNESQKLNKPPIEFI